MINALLKSALIKSALVLFVAALSLWKVCSGSLGSCLTAVLCAISSLSIHSTAVICFMWFSQQNHLWLLCSLSLRMACPSCVQTNRALFFGLIALQLIWHFMCQPRGITSNRAFFKNTCFIYLYIHDEQLSFICFSVLSRYYQQSLGEHEKVVAKIGLMPVCCWSDVTSH